MEGRDKGLMSASLFILNVFTNDSPFILLESLFFQELIGLRETIEDESTSFVSYNFSHRVDLLTDG